MSGSLAEELRGSSDAELAALLAQRPDLAVPVPGDLAVLAARAGVRVSVLRALERLDRFALEVLDAVLLAGADATADAVRAECAGVPPERVLAELDRLASLALLWCDGELLRLVRTVADVVGERPAGLGRPAAALLPRLGPAVLARLLTAFGLPPAGEQAVTAALGAAYGDPARVGALLAAADADERRVLAQLDGGGAVGALSGALRAVAASDDPSPVRRLLARGLLLPTDDETVELPREVGLALRGATPLGPLHPDPPSYDGTPLGAAVVDAAGGGQAAETVRLVEALLENWGIAPPGVLRTGGLGVRELRTTARALDVDEPVAALLLETAYAAGLLDRGGESDPTWAPTPAYDGWLARDGAERWVQLAAAWIGTPRAAGLVGERDERGKALAALGPDLVRPAAAAARGEVLAQLAGADPGYAVTPASLLARLGWMAPRRAGRLRERAVGWALTEAATLGLTGRGALTTAGRALLDSEVAVAARAVERHLPEPVTTVLLQADLTAVAPGPLVPELGRELGLAADVESTGAASVYRFSERSVRRSLDTGRTADELHAFLARLSRTPVPQTLSYLVDDVARRHGVLRAGTAASYLRCDDPALLAEVVASRRTTRLGLRRLAPTVVVSGTPVPKLLEGLRAAGYSPVGEGAAGAVVVSRRDAHRTPVRARVARYEPTPLSQEQLLRAVWTLREGDRATREGRRVAGPGVVDGGAGAPLRDRSTEASVALLQEAVRDTGRVVLEYVDHVGRLTERVVEPRSLESGYLRAYDERDGEERTFAVRNIAGVAPLREGVGGAVR